ncbi:hypothetical protein ACFL21_05005, partial [Patescibacteria group bacterium]
MDNTKIQIGFTDTNDPVELTNEDFIGNTLVIGQSGNGKTTSLINIAVAEILQGKKGLLIDPYGDIIKAIQEYVPKDSIKVFDVKDGELRSTFQKFKEDNSSFYLYNLDYSLIGSHAARNLGIQLVTEFLESCKDIKTPISLF